MWSQQIAEVSPAWPTGVHILVPVIYLMRSKLMAAYRHILHRFGCIVKNSKFILASRNENTKLINTLFIKYKSSNCKATSLMCVNIFKNTNSVTVCFRLTRRTKRQQLNEMLQRLPQIARLLEFSIKLLSKWGSIFLCGKELSTKPRNAGGSPSKRVYGATRWYVLVLRVT